MIVARVERTLLSAAFEVGFDLVLDLDFDLDFLWGQPPSAVRSSEARLACATTKPLSSRDPRPLRVEGPLYSQRHCI